MKGSVKRGDVFLVGLDPTRGASASPREARRPQPRPMKKSRACVVVSPDELNAHLLTAIVAPLSAAGRPYPFRIPCKFEGRQGLVVLDQIRTVDRERLQRRLGKLSTEAFARVLSTLREMFEA